MDFDDDMADIPMNSVDLSKYVNRHADKCKRFVWEVVWRLLAMTTPRWALHEWRNSLLRWFGAKVGKGVRVHGGAKIWLPQRLEIGDNSWIAEDANIYCVAPIRIGSNVVISEGAFVCTAEHDVQSPAFELQSWPIEIGNMAWLGAGAFVLPGRKIGEGAVVAARSVVTHDVEPWMIVAGNPARVIRKREIKRGIDSLITFVVPVKNEEINLPGCLECLKNQPHVIVVDSGSTDRTAEIAKEYGRDVIDFKWNGKFPKKRNWLLQNYSFKTPWVMFLDADERVTDEWVADACVQLQSDASVDAYVCYYDNLFMGRMLAYGDVMHKTAILRLGKGLYERVNEDSWSKLDMEIHEQLVVEGQVGEIRSRLRHYDRRSLDQYLAKHEEYAKWESNRFLEMTQDQWNHLTSRQRTKYRYVRTWWFALAYFIVSYVGRRGFLDGKAGFWFAWYKMTYFRNVRRKILSGGGGGIPHRPNLIDRKS